MDTISKKIASLPLDPETPRAATLQTNIKRATAFYIKENLLSLPALPSVAELQRIQQERSQKLDTQLLTTEHVKIKRVAIETGWTPSSANSIATSVDDPLLEQINNVEHYIKQAESAKKLEEVASLKDNLKMLRGMYRERQKQNISASKEQ